MPGGTTATFVFTDLANSTEILLRSGDEQGRRLFNAHHAALREAAIARGGHQVKWNHDGGFFAFPSVAEAVRFGIAGQQWASVPRSNERLELKVGLNTGEAFFDGEDYFGTAVVVASRLCDAAAPGQVLCSSVAGAMLSGISEFSLVPVAPLALKGIAGPIDAFEVEIAPLEPATALANVPFVGRQRELERLRERYQRAARGDGGLVLVAGEPGIGKTRLVEQAALEAGDVGALVLTGHCFEGDWAPPYAPFTELLVACIASAGAASVAAAAGDGAVMLTRLAPALQPHAPVVEAPSDGRESQFRLLEAFGQLLVTLAERSPLFLIIDDLQWADAASLSLLRYVARMARQHRILVFCTYRDVDVGRAHPLTPVLNALRREVEYDLLQLTGLETSEVAAFIASAATQPHSLPHAFVEAIQHQTEGNPFFIREMLLHLREQGFLVWEAEGWTLQGISLDDLGIPEGARQVIARRLDHVGETAHLFLRAASIFEGPFPFVVAAGTAGLQEEAALTALEQALDARLLAPASGDGSERYDFTHALIRGTLAAELSPSRRMRLHRDAVTVLEGLPGPISSGRAFELAAHCRAAGELADPHAIALHCLR
ncbi:MAG: AAA family ATPase, partial [Tepidiformaceae bacterium]